MIFHICADNNGEFYISPLNGDGLQKNCEVLLPGLPLSFAQSVLHEVRKKKALNLEIPGIFMGRGRNKDSSTGVTAKSEIIKLLQKKSSLATLPWQWVDNQNPLKVAVRDWVLVQKDFQCRTKGRLLAKADLQRLAGECGLTYEEVLGLCQETVLQGRGEWLPAVNKVQGTWRCQRCGETELEEWTSIYGQTVTCSSCATLGSLSSLHALYRNSGSTDGRDRVRSARGNLVEHVEIKFSPRWELSEAQKHAAQAVLEFVRTDSKELPIHTAGQLSKRTTATGIYSNREVLLWAACGAGKTEVCFPATAWALAQGKKVLFAAPRQDVVLDVAPRIQQDFPGLNTAVLTGTSPERFTPAPFVLATTHQILRFYQAFDLIFLDEMDAFPYYGNSALVWGVKQALKPGGHLVYLTATPTTESLAKVKEGMMEIIRLPARHHRRPVPVPEWRRVNGGVEPEHLGKKVEVRQVFRLVEELADLGPVLLFVPKISWVKPWVDLLQKEFPQWKIAGSYSADPLRRDKIEGLRQKRFQAFVSTSILERGVTISNVQVIVLEADHEVFDERALVQMAGRVGRTRENPTGTAIFLAGRKTPGIEKAILWITEQNLLAKEQGLID